MKTKNKVIIFQGERIKQLEQVIFVGFYAAARAFTDEKNDTKKDEYTRSVIDNYENARRDDKVAAVAVSSMYRLMEAIVKNFAVSPEEAVLELKDGSLVGAPRMVKENGESITIRAKKLGIANILLDYSKFDVGIHAKMIDSADRTPEVSYQVSQVLEDLVAVLSGNAK